MPVVSIVIPIYMSEKYLLSCLNSVLNQTLEDIEIICVDDASTDACPGIIDDFAGRDKRIKAIHLETNRKQGYCRDLGLRNAKGKYVYFLDSDDEITATALQELSSFADRFELDGVFFDSTVVYESEEMQKRFGSYAPVRTGTYPPGAVDGEELFKLFIDQKEWQPYIQRQFWKREFLIKNRLGFTEGIIHDDELFSMRAILLADRVAYCPQEYVIRRYRHGSITDIKEPRQDLKGYFTCYSGAVKFLSGRPYLKQAELNIAHLRELCVRYYLMLPEHEKNINLFSQQSELKDQYLLFLHDQIILKEESDYYKELFRELKGYRTVSIYGAGVVGAIVARRLGLARFNIERFIVSSLADNQEQYFGKPVVQYDRFKPWGDEAIIVALRKDHAAEVSDVLRRDGVSHFVWDGQCLISVNESEGKQ